MCRRAGFQKIHLRGDTDFTQTKHLDGWDGAGERFIFGIDATENLKELAEDLPETAYSPGPPPRTTVKTKPAPAAANVKEQIVVEREFENNACSRRWWRVRLSPARLQEELSDGGGAQDMLGTDKGRCGCSRVPLLLLHHQRPGDTGRRIVFEANERCNQENLIGQLKSGVQALACRWTTW